MNVVCLGGSGVRVTLEALKQIPNVEITSIANMVDEGGSSGALRQEFGVLPPGDLRRHISALSEAEEWKRKLWDWRFSKDVEFYGHKGHCFGNVFIAGLETILGDFEKALEIVHEFMKVKGKCLPSTLEKAHLCAKLSNGEVIEGEWKIDTLYKLGKNLRIEEVWLEPEVNAYPKAIEAIEKADFVILGPGDLYTSIIPCLLPVGMREAIQRSNAQKIFIAPAMTKAGETTNFYLEDFVREIEKYMGCELDRVIYNTETPSNERIQKFRKKHPELLNVIVPRAKLPEGKFIGRDLLLDDDVTYNIEKLRVVFRELGF